LAASGDDPDMKRLLASALAALALLAALSPAARAQVAASLVSEDASVQPGRPFTLALRLVHKPHWHSYWINPGTGLPTTLKWTLPDGWKAGDIQWPSPMLLTDTRGNVIGNGYDGDLLLPVTITPPADLAPGTTVTLPVAADWLMCQDECVPGSAKLSIIAPGLGGRAEARPVWGQRIQFLLTQIPATDPSWTVSAVRDPKMVTLVVQAPDVPPLPAQRRRTSTSSRRMD
jgi:DsbC/DsbD-like thiol-disulfide interchange protein